MFKCQQKISVFPRGGRSVAEAGPEVIEALLSERSFDDKKAKDLERPDTWPRNGNAAMSTCVVLAQIRYVSDVTKSQCWSLTEAWHRIALIIIHIIHIIHSTSAARRFEDILATVRSWEGTEVSNKVRRYRG